MLGRISQKAVAIITVMVALGVVLAACILRPTGTQEVFKPLVQQDQWSVTGDFPRFRDPVNRLEVPEQILESPELALWRSWTPEKEGTVGTVSSDPFQPTEFMAVPFLGFPAERPGNRIYLKCEENGQEFEISTQRTNTQWATAFIHVREGFCPGRVKLIASASEKNFYVAVGTPFEISRTFYLSQTSFVPRLLVIFGTWLLAASVVTIGGYFATRSRDFAFPAGFALLAAFGMLVLSAFVVSPVAGRSVTIASVIALLATGTHLLVSDRAKFADFLSVHRVPLFLWLSISVSYGALVSAGDSGGGSWAINGFFTPLRWSSDNQLPFLFAEGLYSGVSLDELKWGPWLASDRTPLFGALLLLPRTLFIDALGIAYGSTFVATAYMMAGITLLSSWSAVFAVICRKIESSSVRTVLILAATSPFFLFNSVFTWGKLLGGSYVVLAFYLLHYLSSEKRSDARLLVIVACCFSAAYLAHASNAFALVPMTLFFIRTIFRQGMYAMLFGTAVAAVIASPWLYWQMALQPNGNALLRFALTGDFGFEKRNSSVLLSAISTLRELGFDGWIARKMQALHQLLGIQVRWASFGEVAPYSPGVSLLGQSRVLDFFAVPRSVGVTALGVLILPVLLWRGTVSRSDSAPLEAAIVGMGTLMFTLIFTMPEPITHHQAYGGLMLVFLAGAWSIAKLPFFSALAISFAVIYCGVVWIWQPLALSLRIDWSTFVVLAVASLMTLYLVIASQDNVETERGYQET